MVDTTVSLGMTLHKQPTYSDPYQTSLGGELISLHFSEMPIE
jgi:hypothetical protein